jgi:hypothetical protein
MAMTAQLFGVSLPTVYQAQAAFAAEGLAGLLPKRRGPKQGHKLTPKAVAWEFLRRNSDYRAAYLSIAHERDAAAVASYWGCAVDPDLRADRVATHRKNDLSTELNRPPKHGVARGARPDNP